MILLLLVIQKKEDALPKEIAISVKDSGKM